MRAEIIAKSSEDPDFLRTNIARYRRMLSVDDAKTIAERRLIEAALSDADELLQATKEDAAC